jgi:hypothetical protein
MKAVVLLMCTFLIFPLSFADDFQATFKRLAQSRSLKCIFPVGTQADWKDGRLKTSSVSEPDLFLHFDAIDTMKGTARLIGSVGADVTVVLTPSQLSFIERTGFGHLNFTTVFPSYEKGAQDFVAVTLRYVMVPLRPPFPLRPFQSQYHGTCQVWW